MATITPLPVSPAPVQTDPFPGFVAEPYRISVDEFQRMVEHDIFPDEVRLELWDGVIYEKRGKNQPHSVAGMLLSETLWRALPPGWCLSAENPLKVDPDKVPLPDVVLLRGSARNYLSRPPEPGDVGLVIEVSDSSIRIDTSRKLAAYADAGVPVYWVINLVEMVVQVYDAPVVGEGRYARSQSFAAGSLIPLSLDGVAVGPIAAADILPLP